jgi:hypothetical protein
MKTTNPKKTVDQIDVEDLIKEFRVKNPTVFVSYLKEIWRVILFF